MLHETHSEWYFKVIFEKKVRFCDVSNYVLSVYLMSLLNWKSNPEHIQDTLKRIMLIVRLK